MKAPSKSSIEKKRKKMIAKLHKTVRKVAKVQAAIDRAENAICSHPNEKVWFYRDGDTFMYCDDCGSRWSKPTAPLPPAVCAPIENKGGGQ